MITVLILYLVIYFTLLFFQRKHPESDWLAEFKTMTSVLATALVVGIISAIDFGINHEKNYNYHKYKKYEIVKIDDGDIDLVTEKGDTIYKEIGIFFSDNNEYIITSDTINYVERYSLSMDTTLNSDWLLRIYADRNIRSVFHVDSATYNKITNNKNE